MVITRKMEVRMSSNFLHSISTSICIIKIGSDFFSHFWKKVWAIVQGFCQEFGVLKKWS